MWISGGASSTRGPPGSDNAPERVPNLRGMVFVSAPADGSSVVSWVMRMMTRSYAIPVIATSYGNLAMSARRAELIRGKRTE